MQILTLIHEYPPVGGGGGHVAQDICRGLVQRGHEVKVLTTHWDQLPQREDDQGVEVIRLKTGRRVPYKADIFTMLCFVWAGFWAGLALIRRWKPDVVHVHFAVPAGAIALGLKRFGGVPYVLTAHLGDVPGGVPEKTDRWFRWIMPFTPAIWKNASQVVAVSQFTQRLALKHYPVPIEVIRNGVDLERLNPGELRLHTPPQIVFAGRFQPQKNPMMLIRVLSHLGDLPWTCTLIGDGPLKAELQAAIGLTGLTERFNLPGWLTPAEVVEKYRHADLMVLPSLSEGLPVVGVQALAMGLALVFSRVGGNIELVQPGSNGYLVDPLDEAGFEQALRTLLDSPEHLLAARNDSRQRAAAFDIQQVVDRYEQVLKAAQNDY